MTGLPSFRALIWDLDNTLYRFDDDVLKVCNHSAARAAVDLGLPMNFEEAHALAWEEHHRSGYSMGVFLHHFKMEPRSFHARAHSFMDETVIKAGVDTARLFSQTRMPHVLLTHASRGWAERVLKRLNLDAYFADTHIFAKEDFDFLSKADSRRPFEMALERLGLEAGADIAVIEDLPRNLSVPKAMGLTTVLLHHGQPPEAPVAHIDHQFDNAVSFLNALTVD